MLRYIELAGPQKQGFPSSLKQINGLAQPQFIYPNHIKRSP